MNIFLFSIVVLAGRQTPNIFGTCAWDTEDILGSVDGTGGTRDAFSILEGYY